MAKQKAKRTEPKKPGNVFDNFVKKMLGRIFLFVDFLVHYADPEFVAEIDLNSIRLAPTHYFGQTGDEQIVDLVFQCALKNETMNILAVILFEHQSGSIRDIPRKLLKYISAIWDAEAKAGLPFSVPYFIVLRTGQKPLREKKPQMSDRFPRSVKGKRFGKAITVDYDVVDLPAWNFDRLLGGAILRAALGTLWKMTHGPEGVATWPEALLPLNEIIDEKQKFEVTKEVLDFVAKAFQAHNQRLEVEDIQKAIKPIFHEKETNMIPTVFEEKFLEGKAEEKIESRIEMILLFLSSRFNGVPIKLEKKIQKINDLEKLNELAKLAGKCENLKEFEKELK